MTSSRMTTVACWALLLLTMFPLRAITARHVPAGPPATSTQTASGVHVSSGGLVAEEGGELGADDRQIQERSRLSQRKILLGFKKEVQREDSIYGHKLLVGSSPPTCQGKCGSCNPCNPIHVSIGSPHGALTQQEYYPEVWRCKCSNRLFMP